MIMVDYMIIINIYTGANPAGCARRSGAGLRAKRAKRKQTTRENRATSERANERTRRPARRAPDGFMARTLPNGRESERANERRSENRGRTKRRASTRPPDKKNIL